MHYLVRFGTMGHVGTFRAAEPVRFPRGAKVILRSSRGLEVGQVLADADVFASGHAGEGELLRRFTTADELVVARLEKHRVAAIDACGRRLTERGISAMLVDVEHLFDGQSLYFYFLGETTPQLELLTNELAELYETKVQFRKFTEAVDAGCGPDCGTDAASGCGSGCSSCVIAEACSSKSKKLRPTPSQN
ncbi:MAG: PSP1 C-terminal domain-containing protein [Pirellulales bacterium]